MAGEHDRAVDYVEEAFAERSSSMPFLGHTPVFHAVRDRPDVRDLMHRIGFPT